MKTGAVTAPVFILDKKKVQLKKLHQTNSNV
jgi:hypothetical protein